MDRSHWPPAAIEIYDLALRLVHAHGKDEWDVGPGKTPGWTFCDERIFIMTYEHGGPGDPIRVIVDFRRTTPDTVLEMLDGKLKHFDRARGRVMLMELQQRMPLDALGNI
jgi:hypothetical protein